MTSTPALLARPDYGLDAPGVIRNLLIATGLGLAVYLSSAVGFWSGVINLGPHFRIGLAGTALLAALGCGAMAAWMVWSSKWGKLGERDRLLAQIDWKGTERVLDVGCGRGLLLIGAAKRLTSGQAFGVDLWQAEDLSGNHAEATRENARLEGVAERIQLHTADMRSLPFPDATFDVILSKAAIHNVYAPAGRTQALAEMARVLAPGGRMVIDDIRHLGQYTQALRANGLEVRRLGGWLVPTLLALITWGGLCPGVLIARKA